jgi:hypothetical protein
MGAGRVAKNAGSMTGLATEITGDFELPRKTVQNTAVLVDFLVVVDLTNCISSALFAAEEISS